MDNLNPLEETGREVDESVHGQLQRGLAKGTTKTYEPGQERSLDGSGH
jgi:hypothetical protein